ncbi:hypothetical protein [Vulgatibacter incomptus]|uniref:Uncharacterized protein n=1 Tax=Vulgatibacter incomptus TaxID=1391653 RepID=A0A0K1PIQ8_9BACT|nr:hypothetical protein [Vulgatibacter incomptus]AKU92994.1 hypothetical protein AKJ08_3381 [Vulgatibacter incomptus]
MRRILAGMPLRGRRMLRLLPSLFHASYPTPELRGEPPGVEGHSARRSWIAIGRTFGLPAPTGTQRARRTIRSLVAFPVQGGVELVVLPIPDARQHELEAVRQRCRYAQGLMQRNGVAATIRIAEPSLDGELFALRLLLFGGLLAGGLPGDSFDSLTVDSADAIAALIDHAPSRLVAASLMMLQAGASTSSPMALLRSRGPGKSAATLSDPELFCAVWVSRWTLAGMLPLEAVRLAGSVPASRRAAARWLDASPAESRIQALVGAGSSDARSFADWSMPTVGGSADGHDDVRSIVTLGRSLTVTAAGAVRRHPLAGSRGLRERFRRAFLTPRGLPAFLETAFDVAAAGSGRLGLEELIELGGGEAAGPLETALVRGLAILGRADGSLAPRLDPPWPGIARRLERAVQRRTFLLSIGVHAFEGPPLDPLNRGPRRRNSLRNPLAVALSPKHRPTARRLLAGEAVRRVIADASSGRQVEILAEDATAEPAASRLARLAARAGAETPLAAEVGGSVLLRHGGTPRRYGLRAFLSRPRRYVPDPEAPDLGAAGGHVGLPPRGTVDCLVLDDGAPLATLIYADSRGFRVREEVHPSRLEAHLAEARELLRSAREPTVLTVRVSGARRAMTAAPPETEPVAVGVEGELLHDLRLTLLGERFGRGGALRWAGAATALLSVWPTTSFPAMRFHAFDVRLRGAPASGLELLYARSVVLRRLLLHMRRMIRP